MVVRWTHHTHRLPKERATASASFGRRSYARCYTVHTHRPGSHTNRTGFGRALNTCTGPCRRTGEVGKGGPARAVLDGSDCIPVLLSARQAHVAIRCGVRRKFCNNLVSTVVRSRAD